MTTTRILSSLLIAAALLPAPAGASDSANAIQVVMEQGKPVAQFRVGDSRCVLKDDQILCTPAGN
jgi:hypothetical protein